MFEQGQDALPESNSEQMPPSALPDIEMADFAEYLAACGSVCSASSPSCRSPLRIQATQQAARNAEWIRNIEDHRRPLEADDNSSSRLRSDMPT